MLQDPENYEEWEDIIWAKNLDSARSTCEYIARRAGLTEVINVTQESKKPSAQGDCRFICWFRSEKTNHDDNN